MPLFAWSDMKSLRQYSSYIQTPWLIMKLLVRNLTRSTTEQEIRVLFSEQGSVTECNLVLDQETGYSKGFAFVEMPNEDEAKSALNALNLTKFGKNTIRVKIANS